MFSLIHSQERTYSYDGFMHRHPVVFTMSLKQKVIIATMIIRGVATFGLMAYTVVNFARWLIEDSQRMEDDCSEDNFELIIP